MGLQESIGVLLRMLPSTKNNIRLRKMGIRWSIDLFLTLLSLPGSKIWHMNIDKEVNWRSLYYHCCIQQEARYDTRRWGLGGLLVFSYDCQLQQEAKEGFRKIRLMGVLLRMLYSTAKKIRRKKMGMRWSIGVPLRWLSATRNKIGHRRWGFRG